MWCTRSEATCKSELVFSFFFQVALDAADRASLPHLLRWFDYIQTAGDISRVFAKLPLPKPSFNPPVSAAGPGNRDPEGDKLGRFEELLAPISLCEAHTLYSPVPLWGRVFVSCMVSDMLHH